MQIVPVESVLGATVSNLDLTDSASQQTIQQLELALERYGVLSFPDQSLTPTDQINFSRAIGEIEVANTVSSSLTGFPEIAEIGNVGNRPVSFAPAKPEGELEWHTDHIQHPIPSKSTLLYAKEVPTHGGDTLFACMYAAYDALDAKTQQRCDQAIAIHSATGLRNYLARQGEFDLSNSELEQEAETVHWPLVRYHPLTGRKALYFAAAVTIGIQGWPDEEALRFISELTTHSTQPKFVYQHKWKVGQVVLWDNRRVLHTGTWYEKKVHRRYLLRTMMRENLGITGPASPEKLGKSYR